MANKSSNNVFSTQYVSGVAFVGSILIGVGFGMLQNNVGPYSVLGLGVGFVLVALIASSNRNTRLKR